MKTPRGKTRILVHVNRYCDRGCRHCMFDSTTEGDSMSPRLASVLPLELAMMSGEKSITISGGGEPLLWPWLDDLVWQLITDRRNKVHLITSGCRNKYDTGYRMLWYLSGIRTARIVPELSFTPYNATSEERLRFTLPLLQQINGRVTVKITSDYTSHGVVEDVATLLQDMGFERGLIAIHAEGYPLRYYRKPGREKWIEEDANLADQHFLKDWETQEEADDHAYTKRIVGVYSQSVGLIGRAKELYKGSIEKSPEFTHIQRMCPWIWWGNTGSLLTVEPDGNIYPCSSRLYGEAAAHLSLGKLGETRLYQALANREALAEKIRRRYITSEDFDLDLCETCRNDGTF